MEMKLKTKIVTEIEIHRGTDRQTDRQATKFFPHTFATTCNIIAKHPITKTTTEQLMEKYL